MIKNIFLILLAAVLYWGYGVYIWRYLIKYRRATSKWQEVSAVVVSTKAYPRSYGIVPTVEYTFLDKEVRIEVIPCYFFSGFSESDKVLVYVDPENNKSCFLKSRSLFMKNLLLLIFITMICVIGEVVFISKLTDVHF